MEKMRHLFGGRKAEEVRREREEGTAAVLFTVACFIFYQ